MSCSWIGSKVAYWRDAAGDADLWLGREGSEFALSVGD